MHRRKGIVLAGGSGTRLRPLTLGVSKQLLPVHDRPMIYFPIATLILAGIEEIAIITTPEDQPAFRRLLGDGARLGLRFEYIVQPSPDGIAQAFLLAEDFLDGAASVLVLGDNIFDGAGFEDLLSLAVRQRLGAHVLAVPVADPRRYGVVEIDTRGRALSLEEKPARPRSNLAVPGLYFLDHEASARARTVRPSARGELEITSLLETYLVEGRLEVSTVDSGFAWFDGGTHESLAAAATHVAAADRRPGPRLGCIEEAAFRRGLIDAAALAELARPLAHTPYGRHLADLAARARPVPAVAETVRLSA